MRARSKTVEIEYEQWARNENGWDRRHEEIVAWVNANGGEARHEPSYWHREHEHHPARIAVRTVNGWAYAAPGHYIVMGSAEFWIDLPYQQPSVQPRGVSKRCRDFYPCDPATFEQRWEPLLTDKPQTCDETGCRCPGPVSSGKDGKR